MDEFFLDSSYSLVMRRALRRLGRDVSQTPQVMDVELRDALAREVAAARNMTSEQRLQALRSLVQPSPGGVMAFAWLASEGEVDPRMMQEFAGIIGTPGFPSQLASPASRLPLSKNDTLVACEAILRNTGLPSADVLGVAISLLMSDFFCEEGRCALLERASSLNCFSATVRLIIFQWALGIDVSQNVISQGGISFMNEIPLPPYFLARPAVLACAASGSLTPAKLARYVKENLSAQGDPVPILMGLLELLEQVPLEVPADLRTGIYDICIDNPDSALRRRAYSVAVAENSELYLQRALKDSDINVRRWAIAKKRS